MPMRSLSLLHGSGDLIDAGENGVQVIVDGFVVQQLAERALALLNVVDDLADLRGQRVEILPSSPRLRSTIWVMAFSPEPGTSWPSGAPVPV